MSAIVGRGIGIVKPRRTERKWKPDPRSPMRECHVSKSEHAGLPRQLRAIRLGEICVGIVQRQDVSRASREGEREHEAAKLKIIPAGHQDQQQDQRDFTQARVSGPHGVFIPRRPGLTAVTRCPATAGAGQGESERCSHPGQVSRVQKADKIARLLLIAKSVPVVS